MATVEAVRQRGRTKYHKKLAPLLFARRQRSNMQCKICLGAHGLNA